MLAVLCVWFFFIFLSYFGCCFSSQGLHNLSRPHAGRSDTADPSPYILLHHLFMTTQPFNHTSHRNVWKCHLSFHQSLETRLPRSKREAQIFALHRASSPLLILWPPFSLVSGPSLHDRQPTQESCRTAGESPCIHRQSTAYSMF